jgi:glycosyltransferase involved in cell wall biosynthesis
MTRDRLRVLLLTETFYPEIGGGERQARLLSAALARRGHDVTVVTRRSRSGLPREEYEGSVRIIRIAPAGRGRWKKWGLALSAIPALAGLRSRADVVMVSGYRIMGIPAVLAARTLGTACVLKADSPGEMSGEFFRSGLAAFHLGPMSPPVRLLVRWRNVLLRSADAFAAISSPIVTELQACGVPPERTHYIPNGVDTSRFRPATIAERTAIRAHLGLPGGPLAIYTGRLVSYKGLPLLLRVWHDLRRSGTSATLVLVGAGSADMHNCEEDLRAYVNDHGLRERIVFTGAVDNVEDYLRAADVFVFPTEKEAFGVSLVEAMACGLPSVATRVGGIPDFLVDGENGLMVDAAEFSQLRDAIATLLAGGDRVATLGQRAYQTALSRFSEDTVADAYLRLFESLLDPDQRRARTPGLKARVDPSCTNRSSPCS